MKQQSGNQNAAAQFANTKTSVGQVVSQRGVAIEVRIVQVPVQVRTAISRALSLGKEAALPSKR